MQSDGLVVAKPRGLFTPRFPWRGLVLLMITIFAFKGYAHYAIGSAEFDQRVMTLSQGSNFEKVGGFVMQADPATIAISQLFSRFTG